VGSCWKKLEALLEEKKIMNKSFYQSKTLWLNVIAMAVLLLQHYTGYVVDPEIQAALLIVINFIVRMITGTPLGMGKFGRK